MNAWTSVFTASADTDRTSGRSSNHRHFTISRTQLYPGQPAAIAETLCPGLTDLDFFRLDKPAILVPISTNTKTCTATLYSHQNKRQLSFNLYIYCYKSTRQFKHTQALNEKQVAFAGFQKNTAIHHRKSSSFG